MSEKKFKNIGAADCDVCGKYRADCIQFRAGLFSNGTVCDGCISAMLLACKKDVGGDAEPPETFTDGSGF